MEAQQNAAPNQERIDQERIECMNIISKVDKTGIPAAEIEAMRPAAGEALDRLWSGNEPMTGWVKAPVNRNQEELDKIPVAVHRGNVEYDGGTMKDWGKKK